MKDVLEVLLDVNVMADAYLQRQPTAQAALAILKANAAKRVRCFVASFSVPTLFYIVYKDLKPVIGRDKATAEAFRHVRAAVHAFRFCPLNYTDLKQALLLPNEDFEDNLQIVCALRAGLDAIVTSDKKFRSTEIEILTPEELLKRIRR